MEKLYLVSFKDKWADNGKVHVLANGWEEAINKATEFKKHEEHAKGIFGEDNSLKSEKERDNALKVVNVELITEEIVR